MNKKLAIVIMAIVLIAAGIALSLGPDQKAGVTMNALSFKASNVYVGATSTPSASSVIVLASKTGRQYAVITNASAADAYIGFNSTSTPNNLTATDFPILLKASSTYVIGSDNLYTGQVVATSTSGVINFKTLDVY